MKINRCDHFHVGWRKRKSRVSFPLESFPPRKRERKLTLAPFSTAVRHLTLDNFENVELKSWMRNFEDPLKDCLEINSN